MSDDSIVMFGFSILCIFFLLLGIILYRTDAAIQALCYFKDGGIYLIKNGRRLGRRHAGRPPSAGQMAGALCDRPFLPDVSLSFIALLHMRSQRRNTPMNLFDILGPVMVGPSSSHTAGAVRIGRMARALLGQEPVRSQLLLHGSFASTGEGHGTHQALVARAAGPLPRPDGRVPDSFRLARERGLSFSFGTCVLRDVHPNSALIRLEDAGGGQLEVGASSPGGGRIRVFQVDGLHTSFSGELPTLVVHNTDQPGCVSQVTGVLARRGLNVATLQLNRGGRGGSAVMVIECDQPIPEDAARDVRALPGILRVTRYTPEEQEVPL